MRAKNGSAAWEIARIAARQHGDVTREQLLAIGLSPAAIGRRLANGVLHPEFRGVYRVGHRAPSALARYAGAVLAVGGDAALCGDAAIYHYGLLRGDPPPPEVVTTANRRIRGVIVHRARWLDEADVRRWLDIPVTTVARTIVDLAASRPLDALARIHHEARIRFGIAPGAIDAVLSRRPNAPGARLLRAVVHGDSPVLLSRLERGFRVFLEDHGFPFPVVNRKKDAHYIDCRWPQHRLTVELDSFRFHSDRQTWEEDRQRDREAHDRGDTLRRFTWRDVFEDQRHMHRQLDRLLPRISRARATPRSAAAA